MRRIAVFAILMALSVSLVGSPSLASSTTHVFPSNGSTVVGSVGFINADQIGYFWSAVRGDRVSQTFTGPSKINGVNLKVNVPVNVLNSGAVVNWDLEINSVVVGSFTVNQGFTGQKTVATTFPLINGPNYAVTLRVKNTVAPGQGSHTLNYAGANPHSIELIYNSMCSGSVAEMLTGTEIDETGPVSGTLHGAEGGAGPAGAVVHEAGCVAAAAGA